MSQRRQKTIAVLLPPAEAERFDAYCQAHGFKKSTLTARLIRDYLDAHGFSQKQARAFLEKEARYSAQGEPRSED